MDGLTPRQVRQMRRQRRARRRPRYKGPSFNRVMPNLLTMLGLCAGLTSIRYALDNRYEHAAVAILVAGIIDGLDGRIARLLKATSRFGAEFDSLSDFASFGVAPPLILFLWSLHGTGRYDFMPCLMFAVCMALRLARFNAALESIAQAGLRSKLLHRRARARRRRHRPVPAFPGHGSHQPRLAPPRRFRAKPLARRSRSGRNLAPAGLHAASLELQELQGPKRIRAAAFPRHRLLRSTPRRRPLAGACRRWHHLSAYAAASACRSFRRLRADAEEE